jgi:hypothetical protein
LPGASKRLRASALSIPGRRCSRGASSAFAVSYRRSGADAAPSPIPALSVRSPRLPPRDDEEGLRVHSSMKSAYPGLAGSIPRRRASASHRSHRALYDGSGARNGATLLNSNSAPTVAGAAARLPPRVDEEGLRVHSSMKSAYPGLAGSIPRRRASASHRSHLALYDGSGARNGATLLNSNSAPTVAGA